MKTATLTMTLMAAAAALGANRTWTGAAGDGLWATEGNWEDGLLPSEEDKVIINTNDSIQLGADRTVGSISFGSTVVAPASGGNLDGEQWTLTVTQGSITGGKSAVVACKVNQPVDGTWKCESGYGNKLIISNDVSGAGIIYCGGGQNNNIQFLGNHVVSVPRIQTGTAGTVVSSGLQVDELTFSSTWADGDKNRTKIYFRNPGCSDTFTLHSTTNGANVIFQNYDVPYGEIRFTVPRVKLDHGLLTLRQEHYASGTNLVTIAALERRPGTILSVENGTAVITIDGVKVSSSTMVYGQNAGLTINGAENNVAGIWQPWCVNNYLYTKVHDSGCLVSCDASKDYTLFPADGLGCSPEVKYRNTVADVTLTQDTEVYALYNNTGVDSVINLGNHDLRFAGGGLFYNGKGQKTILSTGGRLVFASEDVIMTANGDNDLRISAPLAWDATGFPTGHRPSLIVIRTSGQSVVFDGPDEIGVYNRLFSETGKTAQRIEFAGTANREFTGEIGGVFHIYKTGTGELKFSGPNIRRGGDFRPSAGVTVINHPKAPGVTEATGDAVCVVAEGITWLNNFTVTDGAVLCGYGTLSQGVGGNQLKAGGFIGGGSPGQTGTLTLAGDFTPANGGGFYVNIDETSNSSLVLSGTKRKFTLPAAGSTLRVRVAWTGGEEVDVRHRTFKIFDWGVEHNTNPQTANAANADSINFEIVNDSPKMLDVSKATVTLDTTNKCIVLAGVKAMNKGLSVIMR